MRDLKTFIAYYITQFSYFLLRIFIIAKSTKLKVLRNGSLILIKLPKIQRNQIYFDQRTVIQPNCSYSRNCNLSPGKLKKQDKVVAELTRIKFNLMLAYFAIQSNFTHSNSESKLQLEPAVVRSNFKALERRRRRTSRDGIVGV